GLQGKGRGAGAGRRQAAGIWWRLGHPSQAVSLNGVAALLIDQRRLGEAEAVAERARDIAETRLGASHPTTAASLHYLAVVYGEQGRLADAERLFRRCVAALETSYGPDHMSVAPALGDWGRL